MNNFIYSEFIADLSLCDEIVSFHKNSPNKQSGTTNYVVKKEHKDSTDVVLSEEIAIKYMVPLQKVVDNYIERYPSCNMYSSWGILEPISVQHYLPNGGFKTWHTERTTCSGIISSRHLVFMTYLNDVTDEGGTSFMNQNVTINAEKGKTVIFPADWTHTHKGVISPTQEKYIITGWFNYRT